MTDEQRARREVDAKMLIIGQEAWNSHPLIHKELEDVMLWGGISGEKRSNMGDVL